MKQMILKISKKKLEDCKLTNKNFESRVRSTGFDYCFKVEYTDMDLPGEEGWKHFLFSPACPLEFIINSFKEEVNEL